MCRLALLALLAAAGSLASQGAPDAPGIYRCVLAPGGIPVSAGTVVYLSFGDSGDEKTGSYWASGTFRMRVPSRFEYPNRPPSKKTTWLRV